jgi:hypothetical protein
MIILSCHWTTRIWQQMGSNTHMQSSSTTSTAAGQRPFDIGIYSVGLREG